jgi:hypothetical protein
LPLPLLLLVLWLSFRSAAEESASVAVAVAVACFFVVIPQRSGGICFCPLFESLDHHANPNQNIPKYMAHF